MVSDRFGRNLLIRLAFLILATAGLGLSIAVPGYHGVSLVLLLATLWLVINLYHHVNRTNAELGRFLDAARNEDFGQRFESSEGAGFETLSAALRNIMQKFSLSRQHQETALRHLRALTEHMPVPLLSLHTDGQIQLHNNAARRLFSGIGVHRIEDLNQFGEPFGETVNSIQPGQRRLVSFSDDGIERQLTVVATRFASGDAIEKLVSMQDIQSELDDVQLQSWQDLVRVLTHEIMNSITPVESMAKTATELVAEATSRLRSGGEISTALEELDDVHRAVDTVARRSDGLMQFVQSYRSLALVPAPQKQRLHLSELFQRLTRLFSEEWAEQGITCVTEINPDSLELMADPDMLDQLMINLLKNAAEALEAQDDAQLYLSARQSTRGYVLIELTDNGPGIPAEIANEVFVPFYTTKRDGSGVGLALARQIMIAHGGSITLSTPESGGARFTLVF